MWSRVWHWRTSARPSNFHRFQWALDAHLTNSSRCAECIPCLLVSTRKRNVSFSSSFELGVRHLSLSPRPSPYFSQRSESSNSSCPLLPATWWILGRCKGPRFRSVPLDETETADATQVPPHYPCWRCMPNCTEERGSCCRCDYCLPSGVFVKSETTVLFMSRWHDSTKNSSFSRRKVHILCFVFIFFISNVSDLTVRRRIVPVARNRNAN